MTQEEKQKEKELLLNVLKDGLPYGLQLKITDVDGFTFNGELRVLSKNWCRLHISDPVKRAKVKNQTIPLNYIYIKPYLRPMSSMTREEEDKLFDILYIDKEGGNEDDWIKITWDGDIKFFLPSGRWIENIVEVYDYLNSIHVDYRGLIKLGLALEAPIGMYGKEEKK